MEPVVPFWFKQRQGKAEPAGDNVLRLTAPQMPEAFIRVWTTANGRWGAAFRRTAAGPDEAATAPEIDTPLDAWAAAFELYRERMII